jgi:hypothetical protein
MNDIFKKVSISLLILGGAFYVMTGAESITALIPAFLGGIVGGFTLLSDRFPNQSRHFAHVNLFVLGMGVGATYKSVIAIFGYLVSGDALLRPLATVEQFTTFVLCLSAIIVGVQSFIEARKK